MPEADEDNDDNVLFFLLLHKLHFGFFWQNMELYFCVATSYTKKKIMSSWISLDFINRVSDKLSQPSAQIRWVFFHPL